MSDNNKILSVSVAAYNVESTLREALDSFLAPEVLEQVEVLIVDDGSKDSTAAIGREYQEQYPGTFKLISKENGGWGSTLNAAIEAASGRYFKQLDGDDYYSVENLPIFLKFLSESDADMICTAFAIFEDESGGVLSVESRIREFVGINQTLNLKELGTFMPAMHALTVKTKVLQDAKVRITEHCFYTDLEFVVKAYNNCRTFAYMELPIYMYRIGRSGQSMSVEGIRKHYREHQKVLFTCLDYLNTEVTDVYKKAALTRRLEGACTMQYMFYYALECNSQQKREFKEYDRTLMEKYPDFFEKTAGGSRLKILRKTNFLFYKIFGRQNTEQDRRNKKHIFEGN
ncbi:MAG: glycosyltransferase family 2 protein [Parasporobacterium sp.]|nr:glycosyltransferase family 2 protein [Parasporobacterium sp.]